MIPLISIIVPNYNHAAFLKQRLDSIFNQTYQNFEVILLDDCSTDASAEILIEYAKNSKTSQCIFNEMNSGNTFKQWAKGISLAKGEYIWIAESDDFCESNFLEKLMPLFQKNSDVVLAYCQSNRVNERGEKTGNWITHTNDLDVSFFLNDFMMDGNEFIEKNLIYKNVIPNASGVLLRKESAVQAGYLDLEPVLRTCGDWLFYYKLITNNKIAYIGQSLNNFRYHQKSVIANAVITENQISIIDIELKMRQKMIGFIRKQKIVNFKAIARINTKIINQLKYEKALYCIRNDRKLKGGFILVSILDVFIKKYNFRKNIKIKYSNILKLILK